MVKKQKVQRNLIEETRNSAQLRYNDAVNEITELAQQTNCVHLFLSVIPYLTVAPSDRISDLEFGASTAKIEMLAYHLYPYMDHNGHNETSNENLAACVLALDRLFSSYVLTVAMGEDDSHSTASEAHMSRVMRMHAHMVRGSAYREQIAGRISSVMGPFETWFQQNVGIGPVRAANIVHGIFKQHNLTITKCIKSNDLLDRQIRQSSSYRVSDPLRYARENADFISHLADYLPLHLQDVSTIEPVPSDAEWHALIKILGFSTMSRKTMESVLDARDKPLYVLPDGRVILTDIGHTFDTIWDQFESVIRSSNRYESYQRKRTKWLESQITGNLSRVFPVDTIYTQLDYPDPDKSNGGTAELDAAVMWGQSLLLIEAKATQFRKQAQLGHIGMLRSDLRENMQSAFLQGVRASRAIANIEKKIEFIERGSGRKLKLQKGAVRQTIVMTVSLHQLADLATRPDELRRIGLFDEEGLPISLSISELDVLTHFVESPDIFFHYLKKRAEILAVNITIQGDELDYFGAYMSTRLRASKIWVRDGKSPNMVMLSGFQEEFDKFYSWRRGDLPVPPQITLRIPDTIRQILGDLAECHMEVYRVISFVLLDAPDELLDAADKIIGQLHSLQLEDIFPLASRTLSVHCDGCVIIVVGTFSDDLSALNLLVESRVTLEKYRRRAETAVGFGVRLHNRRRSFDCATLLSGEWKQDAYIEKMLAAEKHRLSKPRL